ncbi:cell division protein SepF [Gordonia desulfuricans]|uniref:Cell division protein SepF n=1 Tax=Gordonia desulfuricans TaxID=89051 RepID=A0A7K3LQF1_9ACTN|nr:MULTISPECIES: cell division protein SepF [Gordonia]NDK90494.1 cell division protein SepF [Gordonia desulfuricans]WLP90407.1 cell division protein SepF [Gordonia sp. NB41Y]
MTTMQKFKAYFGMVPPSEYEDDYLDEPGPGPVRGAAARERAYRDEYYGDGSYRDGDASYRDGGYREGYASEGYAPEGYAEAGYRDADQGYADERRYGGGSYGHEYAGAPEYTYAGGRHGADAGPERVRPVARLEPLQRSSSATLRAASAPRSINAEHGELERVFADGPLHKITTLRPSDYSEARTIGERFRDGNPVIMDLVNMSNDDAKRLVDFAAGLAFALRGSFDKVATKVFLLSPADIDVSAEDRRKIAETGFYNQS